MIHCPVCGSTTVYLVAGGCLGQVFQCKECRYQGSFILDEEHVAENNGSESRSEEMTPDTQNAGEYRDRE